MPKAGARHSVPTISLKGIHKVYRTGRVQVHALREVDLEIPPREYVAIMGPSGSGKTTLMNLLGCLDRPTSGHYLFEGEEIGKLDDNRLAEIRNRKIGFVFQTYNLLPRSNALDNVRLPLLYAGVRSSVRALEMLKEVGLSDRMRHLPGELSGGQQQRVSIARALVNHPSVILADEPTGNLDSKSGREILKIFRELYKRHITIVMVTHSDEVAAEAHRIVTFRDGRIVSDKRGGKS